MKTCRYGNRRPGTGFKIIWIACPQTLYLARFMEKEHHRPRAWRRLLQENASKPREPFVGGAYPQAGFAQRITLKEKSSYSSPSK